MHHGGHDDLEGSVHAGMHTYTYIHTIVQISMPWNFDWNGHYIMIRISMLVCMYACHSYFTIMQVYLLVVIIGATSSYFWYVESTYGPLANQLPLDMAASMVRYTHVDSCIHSYRNYYYYYNTTVSMYSSVQYIHTNLPT